MSDNLEETLLCKYSAFTKNEPLSDEMQLFGRAKTLLSTPKRVAGLGYLAEHSFLNGIFAGFMSVFAVFHCLPDVYKVLTLCLIF